VWMYALDGVQPVEWTYYGADRSTPAGYLSVYLNDLDKNAKVRKTLTDLKVRYAIVGKGLVTKDTKSSVGFLRLDSTPGFKQVFKNDGATIYEIEGQQGVVTSGAASGAAPANGQ
jgi:hypothetical protein